MKLFEEIEKWKAKDGAVLVRVEFLDKTGAVEEVLPDVVAADYRIKADAFAYLPAWQERPHFVTFDGVRRDGDEVVLMAPDRRVVVSPLWLDEQAREAREWLASDERADEVVDGMVEIFDAM